MKYTLVIMIASSLLTAGCSDTGNDANVFEAQVESIEKAEDVEQQIIDAAERQRRQIEENINR